MGKKTGKTGMGGAGKLKEGQIKNELWGPCRERTGCCISVGWMSPRSSSIPGSSHTQHNLQKAESKPLVPPRGRHSSSSKGFSKLDQVFTMGGVAPSHSESSAWAGHCMHCYEVSPWLKPSRKASKATGGKKPLLKSCESSEE